MNRFNFEDLDKIILEISNSILGDISTKQNVQDILCKTIVLSCDAFNSDPYFKKKIDALAEYYNMKS